MICGTSGTQEARVKRNTSGGFLEEVTVVPCLDCTDLLTWTAWAPCPLLEEASLSMQCRRRGNNLVGHMEEKREKKGIVSG